MKQKVFEIFLKGYQQPANAVGIEAVEEKSSLLVKDQEGQVVAQFKQSQVQGWTSKDVPQGVSSYKTR